MEGLDFSRISPVKTLQTFSRGVDKFVKTSELKNKAEKIDSLIEKQNLGKLDNKDMKILSNLIG
jgi:hypothetical protein